jgi:3-methyladenine DNA glycosylase/8-oxoguanine DNA glycosylase
LLVKISVPDDFSLFEVIHSHGWRHLLPFGSEDEGDYITRVHRLTAGQVLKLDIMDSGNGCIEVRTDTESNASEIEEAVRRMLQIDHSLSTFHEYCQNYPELTHIPERNQGRFLCSPTVFEDCVKVILTMNTTWAQTKVMVARVVGNYGSMLPLDPAQRSVPHPEQSAIIPFEEFADSARLGYRAKAVHKLACDVTDGKANLERLRDQELSADEVLKQLHALHGIGPYGAACLMLYLGRGNCVNVDSWARTLLAQELDRPVTDKEVTDYFAKYGEWQGFVYSFYSWKNRSAAATADIAA